MAGGRRSLVDAFISSIRQRYASYSGNYGDLKAKEERARLGRTMLDLEGMGSGGQHASRNSDRQPGNQIA